MEPPRNRKSLLAPDHRAPEANDTTLTVTGGTYSNGAIGIDVDGATATASGATISNNDTGVYIRNGGTGTFTDNCITDNTSYGMNNTTGAAVAAVVNWWGDASGPYHATTNPTGAGDAVSDDVAFAPWISDGCHGTVTTGHWLNLRTGAYSGLASALATAISGDTIQATCPDATSIPGGGTATVGNVTIDLNGCTAGPGSPFLIVNADNVTVLGPGLLDGWDGSANSLDPGIKVLTGADNFILQGAEVKRWADGIELAGSVNSFKLGGNWIHSNTDAGLQVDTGVTLGGVVTIQGNLFKANGGNGIQNNGVTNPLRAEYNSWGHLLGPASGDGASAQVDYTPWTFIEPFLDMAPEAEATAVDVAESDSFDVKLKMDAAKVYGFSFQITYDTAWLTLDSVTFAAPWNGSGRCVSLGSTPGVLRYRCSLQFPDAEYDADGGTIATLNFTAAAGPAGENGPWPTTLDILHDPLLTKAGAIGGEKIFVDNAGYNDPSIPERDITDADDGWVNIVGLANFTGYVDLQGRLNDGLAWIEVHQSSTYGSTLLATGTTASSGGYTTSHTTGNRLLVGGTYWLLIDRDLYLPTSVLWPTPMPYEDSKPLDDRPLTALDMAFLLGGDATDNDHVDINDATCIGWDYGSTVSTCIGEDPLRNAHSDVNGDGLIDLYDLVLMGTNYTWSYSPWSP